MFINIYEEMSDIIFWFATRDDVRGRVAFIKQIFSRRSRLQDGKINVSQYFNL